MGSQEPEEDGVTSDYDDSVATSEFTSVNTACLAHSYEHGRRYQGFLQDRYGLPNDDAEELREGVRHKLYLDYILDGQLFVAPIGENPQKIVDLGTGFGFWALDVADRYPSARVIGTDLSPVQPRWTPPNVEFRVEDLDDDSRPWSNIYRDADLMHFRFVLPTFRRPRQVLQRCLENLKPGGWIESHDMIAKVVLDDGSAGVDHPIHTLYNLVEGPYSRFYGWNIQFPSELANILREMGFVNVSVKHNMIPVGRWHREARLREMGMFTQSVLSEWIVAMLARHETLGLNEEEAYKLGQDILDAFNNPRIHAQHDWVDVWAQKPLP